MKRNIILAGLLTALAGAVTPLARADAGSAPKEQAFASEPLGVKVSLKMVGPYMEAADLQIICLFKHKATGDNYQGAAVETDKHLGGLLSALRNRGEFIGEAGETLLFTPGTIPASQFLIIGLGEEKELSLETLKIAGRVAAREAVRLKAAHVAWAPVIRDQGNATLDVGAGDRAFVSEFLAAYDTEKRLQNQGLAPAFSIATLVVEAGPAYFDGAAREVGAGIDQVLAELGKREAKPYRLTTP